MTATRLTPVLVALAAFAVAIARAPSDPDMFWHLASGKWMVEHGAILRNDVFSSTVTGQPYSVGEWLGEIVLYEAYALAGWAGIVLLRGILVAIAAFFVTRIALRAGHALVAVPLAIAALLLSSVVWTDRPQLFTLALFPLLLDVLLLAREGRTRLLAVVPPLLLVWTDLHGGYALGLALVLVFALDAVIRRSEVRAYVVVAALAAAATLLDPGALGIGAAVGHAASPPRYIVEEAPPDVLTPAGMLFALFVLGTLAVGMRTGGTLVDAFLLIPLLWLALSAQRDMPYFAFAAVPYLAGRAAGALPRLRWTIPLPAAPRVVLPAIAIALVAVAILALGSVPAAPNEAAYPARALAAVRSGTGTLLNEYDWGGYLIWNAPERPVFIDGRLLPYLPNVLADFNTAVALGPGWRDILTRDRVTAVLLRPDRPLVGALREDGWRDVVADTRFVLLERP
ncbi:MAG TPA: hypothetical protein VI814_03575 [Candidatus Limnocylindria bacterium]